MSNEKVTGNERVTAAVMVDPVVVAAVEHAGQEKPPSKIAAERAEQSETILRTEGQRATSMLWESTQMRLALLMVGGFMMAHVAIVGSIAWVLLTNWVELSEHPATLTPLMVILTAALGAIGSLAAGVVATYFNRTNSHRVGGVGGDDVRTSR